MRPFSLNEPRQIIAMLASFIIATSIHEFMHAWTAWRLGDDTARRLGRITLNPASHFEPFGLFGMIMISLGFPFIGWGKPVPVNPSALRRIFRGRPQTGMAIVAFAGPLSNVVQALVAAIPLQVAARTSTTLDGREFLRCAFSLTADQCPDTALSGLYFFLAWFMTINILLASFNMIPVPPLDGHKILTGLLPAFWYPILAPLERYGFVILLLLIFVGGGTGASLIGGMIDPVRDSLTQLVFAGLI